MKEATVPILNKLGLHARACAMLVRIAEPYAPKDGERGTTATIALAESPEAFVSMLSVFSMISLDATVGKEVIIRTSGHDEEFLLLVLHTAIKCLASVKKGEYNVDAVFEEVDRMMFDGNAKIAVQRNIDYFADCANKAHSHSRFNVKATSNISRLALKSIIKVCRLEGARICMTYASPSMGNFAHNLWEGEEYDLLLEIWSSQPMVDSIITFISRDPESDECAKNLACIIENSDAADSWIRSVGEVPSTKTKLEEFLSFLHSLQGPTGYGQSSSDAHPITSILVPERLFWLPDNLDSDKYELENILRMMAYPHAVRCAINVSSLLLKLRAAGLTKLRAFDYYHCKVNRGPRAGASLCRIPARRTGTTGDGKLVLMVISAIDTPESYHKFLGAFSRLTRGVPGLSASLLSADSSLTAFSYLIEAEKQLFS